MIRPEVIRKRLNKLDEYLAFLERARAYSLGEFLEDPERYGSVERFLQLAIEVLTDMGSHVIAELAWGIVNKNSDIPSLFREQGYIDEALEHTWIRMIGFRNVLVHDYLDIDRTIVYGVLHAHLSDLYALRKVFARFL
jgi:uncharacterized protein YutE (UPF0331/DUF86 family)